MSRDVSQNSMEEPRMDNNHSTSGFSTPRALYSQLRSDLDDHDDETAAPVDVDESDDDYADAGAEGYFFVDPDGTTKRPAKLQAQRSPGSTGPSEVESDDDMSTMVEGGPEPRRRSWAMRAYAKMCYFTPLGSMIFIVALFVGLVYKDRPLALAALTVYVIHHAWCHLVHVFVFSWIGQNGIRKEQGTCSHRASHEAWLKKQGGVYPEDHVAWDDVIHVVILPNYKVLPSFTL